MNQFAVTKLLLPSSADTWMFHRECFIARSESEARAKAVSLVKDLEHEGYHHYRNYKDQELPPQRTLGVYSRSRWGLKKVVNDEEKPCYDIRILPIDECFDHLTNKWIPPRWMLYNHVEEDHRFVLTDLDTKLLVAAAAMESSDFCDFRVLDMKWTEEVNLAFRCIEKNAKGLVSNDEIILSLFPLQ